MMFVRCIVFVSMCVYAQAQKGPVVNTVQGKVVGLDESEHYSFYGIPYGGPTSGGNRFKPPIPSPSYIGEYWATNKNIKCAQISPTGIVGTENCLVLNIHTRNLTSQYPVLVLIESENYETTSTAKYSYDNLVSKDLVIVSLNYRLSIFGFLCLRIPEAPGNVGLLDIVLGMKWIQQNIANFGGDPKNIVLFGHGSGAALADILTLSPIAKGLAHKAIILSGSALAPWAVSYNNIDSAYTIGTKLNITQVSRAGLVKALLTAEVKDLLEKINETGVGKIMPSFGPCIDDNILPDDPIKLLRSGRFNDLPYLTGYTDNEGTIKANQIANGLWAEKISNDKTELLPPDLKINIEKNRTCAIKQVLKIYFLRKQNDTSKVEDFFNYTGSVFQMIPIIRTAKERALKSKENVFLFEFMYRGSYDSDWKYPFIPLNGAKHGDIIKHLLDFDLVANNSAKRIITERFVKFAQTGFPEPNLKEYTSWLPINKKYFYYLIINGTSILPNRNYVVTAQDINPHSGEMQFWDVMYSKYYRPLRSSANMFKGYLFIIFYCYVCGLGIRKFLQ